jgi:DNA-binding CsgD family transcriptional regulator
MSFLSILWLVLVPLVVMIALVDVLSQSQSQRVRRLSRSGLSQRTISERCGISRYKVRQILLTA